LARVVARAIRLHLADVSASLDAVKLAPRRRQQLQ
jgi:hypothetical protein